MASDDTATSKMTTDHHIRLTDIMLPTKNIDSLIRRAAMAIH